MSHKQSMMLTIFTAFLWSLAGWNVKMINWPANAIAGARCVIAAIVLIPILIKGGKLKLDRYVLGGAVCYTTFNYCFNISTKLATSTIAIMMQYTAPIYVAVLAWFFFKEKITKMDLFAIAAVIIGMVFFFLDGGAGGSMLGKIAAVFNGISFAGMSIFLRFQKEGNPVASMFVGNIFSIIIGIPSVVKAGVPDRTSFLFLLLAGFLCGFTYTLYAIASKGLTALETVMLPVIDPVLNPVWVFLFMHEAPGMLTVIGACIILFAVLARSLLSLRTPKTSVVQTAS
ncbi:MAG: DMT family transporter [Eubacteriales bacterium]|nr:DMT family transporter [Eubacteriales bacterium]